MDLNNLNDIEQLKRLIVDPMIETIRAEIRPIARTAYSTRTRVDTLEHNVEDVPAAVTDQGNRLAKLESNQKKALLGYSGIVLLVTMGFNYAKAKWFSKFFS